MLRFLRVRQLAVIDEVQVEFGPGFNVLTGETGAGKSILVEAVGLLLGGRASADLVRTGADAASVEAIFESSGVERVIRREVTSQGRSRAYIDGELATAASLQQLTAGLIELHGQHEHHVLLDSAEHLNVLDSCGRLERDARAVADAFEALRAVREALARAERQASEQTARKELLTFQLGELERAALELDEDEALLAMRQVLASADRLSRLSVESYEILYEHEHAVLGQLASLWRKVGELAAVDPRFVPYLDARDGIKSQLEDLAFFLLRYGDAIDSSPERLREVEDRLAVIERLKRKYGPTLEETIARRDRLRAELEDLAGADERSSALAESFQSSRHKFLAVAGSLTAARRKTAAALVPRLERMLAELAMEHTVFEVRFNASPLAESQWSAAGVDSAEFFVSPNPGEEVRPLARIASGGELSRIMLAVKTMAAGGGEDLTDGRERPPGAAAPGLIFDEIDAGIGGRAADVIGRKLRGLGGAFQVLCITHLPQVAAYADVHFAITKRIVDGRTRTSVARLDEAARVEELARMLGGEGVTESLRTSAREMLKLRQAKAKGEPNTKGEGGTTKITKITKITKNTENTKNAKAKAAKRTKS